MKAYSLFLILFIQISAIENYSIIDKLFESDYSKKNDYRYVVFLTDSIVKLESSQKNTALIELAHKSHRYRGLAIRSLIAINDSTSVQLLDHFSDSLYFFNTLDGPWGQIGKSLVNNPFLLKEFHSIFFKHLSNTDNENSQIEIALYFKENALYSDLDRLLELKDHKNAIVRESVWGAQVIYKTDSLSERVRSAFKNPLYQADGVRSMVKQCAVFNRYDYLPDLIAMKKSLEKEVHPLHVDAAEKIITEINKTVPKLDKAQKEKLPIGKPLD